jgi:enoyl-CoA hydratase/carnithine racemase
LSESGSELLCKQDGGILHVTINRPHAANAINGSVSAGLVAAVAEANGNSAIRSVILTGSGTRAFCAGRDLKNPDDLDAAALSAQRRDELRSYTYALLGCTKPLVVALNGVALGAGLMLALHADIIVAADTAAVALPEIDIGIATFLGHALLAQRVGEGVANDLALTGRRMPATEATERGIVAAAFPIERLKPEAVSCAIALAQKPAETFLIMKSWILRRRREAVDAALRAHDQIGN